MVVDKEMRIGSMPPSSRVCMSRAIQTNHMVIQVGQIVLDVSVVYVDGGVYESMQVVILNTEHVDLMMGKGTSITLSPEKGIAYEASAKVLVIHAVTS